MWRSIVKDSISSSSVYKGKRTCNTQTTSTFKKQCSLLLSFSKQLVCKRNFLTSNKPTELIIPLEESSPLHLSYGKLARFADGSCVASIGGTSVLVTAVSKKTNTSNDNATVSQSVVPAAFVPLTVDYRQKAAAAGRIPTNHLRRELGSSDQEILTSRVIDRSIRPLFPKGYGSETQVVCNLLSADGIHDPTVVALNGCSAALAVSDIPWNGPIGATRVGYSNAVNNGSGGFILNPTRKDLKTIMEEKGSSLNLLVSGTTDSLVVMLEADASCMDPKLFLDGIKFGLKSACDIATHINNDCKSKNITKRPGIITDQKTLGINEDKNLEHPLNRAYNMMELMCEQKLRTIYTDKSHDKTSRDIAAFSVRDNAINLLRTKQEHSLDPSFFYDAFNRLSRNMIASLALDDRVRVDGRGFNDIRPISCHVDTHTPLHGSAIFQRGQTQVFCTVSLDSLESTALKIDPVSALMGSTKEKNFFLHYEFPPYATNEIGRTGSSSGRRELGHGALAEKALKAVVPKNHPFTIRLTSEVLESNGSSSMASVCGGSLALLDAGVPLVSPAAGVAMGLMSRERVNNNLRSDEDPSIIQEHDREYAVLTDILGMEDYLGDMDFKVAGTRYGITALQADVKLPGIPLNVVDLALSKGHSAINAILDIMESSRENGNEPRESKGNWPVTEKINVPSHKRARFLGPGGINLKRLLAETGVQLTPESGTEASTTWSLFAPNSEALQEAHDFIEEILAEAKVPELEFGSIYPSIIREIRERGVMVELHPELPLVMVTNSQLDAKKVCIHML